MLIHVLWAAVAIYAIHRMSTAIEQFAPAKHEASAEEPAPEVPDDLVAYAMSFSETWAQEDAMRAIQQSYEQWKDWNRVRAAMGIGGID
jgi:hypothetical protein